jgi:hypothetical protein
LTEVSALHSMCVPAPNRQTVEKQIARLTEIAKSRGWQSTTTDRQADVPGHRCLCRVCGARRTNWPRKLLAAGRGINRVAKAVGLSNGTVARVKAEMVS